MTPITINFLSHIFGDQINEGLEYLKAIATDKDVIDKHRILFLQSENRATGKTTFLEWINILFKDRACYICNSELLHNQCWHEKLIVACDEVGSKVIQKNIGLSTEPATRFILCSNILHEVPGAWVRVIPTISIGSCNPFLIDALKSESADFLSSLKSE